MISAKMTDALNKQLNKELYSAYLYLAMSAYFEDKNLKGMARWMRVQADEEHIHGMKFFDFIQKVGSRVKLEQIQQPGFEWSGPVEVFQEAFEHEQFITKSINELVDLAMQERDHATSTFLHWFVDEQVEEEAIASDIVQKFNLIGDSKGGLFMLDRELGSRIMGAAPNNV
ncbi:MAG: ferritin [Bacteroidetes bacterium]|nr:ferritin [Bacteroidota bacterium]MBU1677659.1 ferritin [Bacteroidota bacterium]MBU2506689.1 ferritin [Bacteroidota bacterium]